MTELQLYKYVSDNQLEWKWDTIKEEENVLLFLQFDELEGFCKLAKEFFDSDWSIPTWIRSFHAVILMSELCFFYDIEMENVFPKEEL